MKVFTNIQNRIKGNLIYGVHLDLKPDGGYNSNIIALKRLSDSISLEKDQSADLKVDDLPKNAHISVCLTGYGILTKQVDTDQLQEGFDTILPNGKVEDFVFQTMPKVNQNKSLVNIIRKDSLLNLITELKQKNLWVIDLHLGLCSLQNILPWIQDVSELKISGIEVQFEKGKLKSFRKVESSNFERYRIGDEMIDANQVLSFGTGVSALAVETEVHLPEMLKQVRKEAYARKYMLNMQFAFLVLVFVSLLINFIQFDGLNLKQTELTSQLQTGRSLLSKMNQLQAEVDEKEAFFVKSGLSEPSKLSYYSDRIAKLLPVKLKLKSLDLYPQNGKIKQGKEIGFQKNSILISGTTKYPVQFNNWIQKLKKESWVNDIHRQEYYKKDQSKPGEFIVEISIKQ